MAPQPRTVGRATRREGGFHHLGARIGEAGGMERTATAARGRPAPVRWLAALPTSAALGILVTLLCVVGLVMVGSASPVISLMTYHSPWTIFIRQTLWMVVGVAALLIFARIDYRKWRKLGIPLVVVTIGLLFAVLVPGLGVTAGGSSRWIGFGLLRLQPSELMTACTITSLPSGSTPAASQPRIIGRRSAGRPMPRNDQRSW